MSYYELKLCNVTFESSVVPVGWREAAIILLYKSEMERTGCNNYSDISFESVFWKIYLGVLMNDQTE